MREKILSIIEPRNYSSRAARYYDKVMVVAIIMNLLPLAFREQPEWLLVCDRISCGIFVMDYLLRWLTADKTGNNKPSSFLLYPFRPMAIADLLSILPSLASISNLFRILRVTRLLRILHLLRVLRYYRPLQIMIRVIRKEITTLFSVFVFALFYILITALVMFNVEDAVDPATGEPVFSNFFDAIYWATCTLTTVGYGDICPISPLARFVSMISAMIGIAIIALPSGIISASYMAESAKVAEDSD